MTNGPTKTLTDIEHAAVIRYINAVLREEVLSIMAQHYLNNALALLGEKVRFI